MNISLLKQQAHHLLNHCKQQYQKILLMVLIMKSVSGIYTGQNIIFNILTLIIATMMISIDHGIIVSSLKIIRHQSNELDDQDAYIGIRRWKELLSTYLMKGLFVLAIPSLISIILILILFMFIPVSYDLIMKITTLGFNELYQQFPALTGLIFLFLLFIMFIQLICSSLTFLMPYLYEDYHLKPFQCLKKSIHIMKNYIFDYIRLELSFIGWIILVAFIDMIILYLGSMITIIGIFSFVISAYIQVYLYYPHYTLTQALFYKEIGEENEI